MSRIRAASWNSTSSHSSNRLVFLFCLALNALYLRKCGMLDVVGGVVCALESIELPVYSNSTFSLNKFTH